MKISPIHFQNNLFNWYEAHQRVLPWRARLGEAPNPYHVFLSEIMLQQTTVPTVISYFEFFITKWPTIHDLAKASLDEILHAWQGLGYYARARNLHKCAGIIAQDYGGKFPEDEQTLLSLPGIGPYTAAAILAIAFGKSAVVVDGNVDRIISRVFAIDTPLPQSKPLIKEYAASLTPSHHGGDYAQAMMDLGSMICKPTSPLCSACPVQEFCLAHKKNLEESYPKFMPKVEKPSRYGTVFWIENHQGEVLIRRRSEKGLLGGMMEIPSSPWQNEKPGMVEQRLNEPCDAEWEEVPGVIKHTFTHFHLYLRVLRATGEDPIPGLWVHPTDFHHHAFPTLMKKVIRHIGK